MEERRYSTSVLTDSEKLNMKKKQRRKGRERKHFHVFCKPDRDILTSLMLDSYKQNQDVNLRLAMIPGKAFGIDIFINTKLEGLFSL